MEKQFVCEEVIQRVGYTVIDGVKVAQYTCILPTNKPEEMRLSITRLNPDMYKEHREECRADYATFEDDAYVLQEKYTTEA
jgi:hypothetical protein